MTFSHFIRHAFALAVPFILGVILAIGVGFV